VGKNVGLSLDRSGHCEQGIADVCEEIGSFCLHGKHLSQPDG